MKGYDPIFPTTKGILRKLGGDEKTVKNVVYEKAEVPFYPHENNLSITQIGDEQKNVAVFPGMVLTVHYDGADYKCELVKVDEETLYFGNIPTSNEWNESGMPFLGTVFADVGLSNIVILVNNTAESHIIGISISTETIVPIDQKYLPSAPHFNLIEMGLPTVDVSSSSVHSVAVDTTELRNAALAGPVWLTFRASINNATFDVKAIFNAVGVEVAGMLQLNAVVMYGAPWVFSLIVDHDRVSMDWLQLATA